MTPLQKLLIHPFIKKAGVAVGLFPDHVETYKDRERSRKRLVARENIRPEELSRIYKQVDDLENICKELKKSMRDPDAAGPTGSPANNR